VLCLLPAGCIQQSKLTLSILGKFLHHRLPMHFFIHESREANDERLTIEHSDLFAIAE
jgi:hypothetical protein